MSQIIKKNKVKVMFIVGSLGTGGAERFVANALTSLSRENFELSAAFYRPDRTYDIPDDVLVTILGKHKPWDNIRAAYRFKCWIDKVKPDVIISAWSVPNIFTAETLRWTKHKPKWIARIANDPTKQELGLYGKWAESSYKKADAFICVASELAKTFEYKYPFAKSKISTIHNAVDVEVLKSKASEEVIFPEKIKLAKDKGIPIIISIGRLENQKRFDIMLRAFANVLKERSALLIILGDGSLRHDLDTLVDALGISNNIIMPGFVKNPYAWLKQADIFSLSSDHEGMSNALLEAQALGLPAIATDCPFGTAEVIVDHNTGFLVNTGDVKSLTKYLLKLIKNHELRQRMSIKSQDNILENFTITKCMERLSKLISDITLKG